MIPVPLGVVRHSAAAVLLAGALLLGGCVGDGPVDPPTPAPTTPVEPTAPATTSEVPEIPPVPCGEDVVPASQSGNQPLDAVLESDSGLVACVISIGSTSAPEYVGLKEGQEITEVVVTVENRTSSRITLPGGYDVDYTAFERSNTEPTFRLSGHGTPLPEVYRPGQVSTGRFLFSNGPQDRGDQHVGWFDLRWWENPQR